MQPDLRRRAVRFANSGKVIIPLFGITVNTETGELVCSCGDPACGSPGKHPMRYLVPRGLTDGSKDKAVVDAWWAAEPSANIGIVTGADSGIVVIDVDVDGGGLDSLEVLRNEYDLSDETCRVRTGSGGWHYYLKHPGGKVGNRAKLMPGIDVRGDGGYVVGAGSLHRSGKTYDFVGGEPPACIPAKLLPFLADHSKPQQAATVQAVASPDAGPFWLAKALGRASVGNRNETGAWLAQQLRDAGMPASEADHWMRQYADSAPAGDSPYTYTEALASLRSAYGRGARPPAESKDNPQIIIAPPRPVIEVAASAELLRHRDAIMSGQYRNVDWPWSLTTRATNALLPASVVMFVGDPGVGKTFLMLQCLNWWRLANVTASALFVEKDQLFHYIRLVAQLAGNPRLIDPNYVAANQAEFTDAVNRNAVALDAIGRRIKSFPEEDLTFGKALGWMQEQMEGGSRIVAIDPITLLDYESRQSWDEDKKFIKASERLATKHGASVILVTHAKKGNRTGAATSEDMALGAAYNRACDTLIWVSKPKKQRAVKWKDKGGFVRDSKFGFFFQLHKTRNGKGAGKEVAFKFENLLYHEQGLVVRDLKADEWHGGDDGDEVDGTDWGEIHLAA